MCAWRKIGLCLALTIFVSCTNDMRDVRALPENTPTPSQIGDTVTMFYTDSARLKLVVKANKMLVYDKNVDEAYTELPAGVFVTFYNDSGKVSATLKADYGVRYEGKKRMEARYAVEVINSKGEKLETEKLIWDENAEKIHTDEFVKITTDKQVIMGTGMESNQDFSRYEIKKVTGILQLSDNGT